MAERVHGPRASVSFSGALFPATPCANDVLFFPPWSVNALLGCEFVHVVVKVRSLFFFFFLSKTFHFRNLLNFLNFLDFSEGFFTSLNFKLFKLLVSF